MNYGGHSYGEGSSEKAKKCRTCVDFKTWMKQQRGSEVKENNFDQPRRPDCPLDKDELGRATWAFLHTTAANFPDEPTFDQKNEMRDFIKLFSRFYPCEPCAQDFRHDIAANPPVLESQKAFSKWLCDRHNVVNRKLGKAEFDCRLVDQRWKDGWADGSCG